MYESIIKYESSKSDERAKTCAVKSRTKLYLITYIKSGDIIFVTTLPASRPLYAVYSPLPLKRHSRVTALFASNLKTILILEHNPSGTFDNMEHI